MERIIRIDRNANRRAVRDWGESEIELPVLHADQVHAFNYPARHKAIRCGRRWGKTMFCETIATAAVLKGEYVGWFAPQFKLLSEAFGDMSQIMGPIITTSSRTAGVMRTTTGGRIDFWSLDNERAGRSRKYHWVILDEAAFAKPNMTDVWQKAIEPTLLDFRGRAIAASNTNGLDTDNFFWKICNEPKWGFREYWAPSKSNPYLPDDEIEALRQRTHPLVFEQEYEAKFIDWSGAAFFSQRSLLDENEKPVPYPVVCDSVFATIDTAIKDKSENDGTGVTYWAYSQFVGGIPLVILDYDVVQVEGSLLENWLPGVYQRLEELARLTRSRRGSIGAFIEDKGSGTILLQQAKRRGWPAHPIKNDLTKLGKDARCISVSGYVHRGMVKISEPAYNRLIVYKGTSRNHLLAQVVGYRVGIDSGEDDLLDCFTYGTAIALGDSKGF